MAAMHGQPYDQYVEKCFVILSRFCLSYVKN